MLILLEARVFSRRREREIRMWEGKEKPYRDGRGECELMIF